MLTCAKNGEQFTPPSTYANCLQSITMRDPTTGVSQTVDMPICPSCFATSSAALMAAFPNSPQALAAQAAQLQADATAVAANAAQAAAQIAAAGST